MEVGPELAAGPELEADQELEAVEVSLVVWAIHLWVTLVSVVVAILEALVEVAAKLEEEAIRLAEVWVEAVILQKTVEDSKSEVVEEHSTAFQPWTMLGSRRKYCWYCHPFYWQRDQRQHFFFECWKSQHINS